MPYGHGLIPVKVNGSIYVLPPVISMYMHVVYTFPSIVVHTIALRPFQVEYGSFLLRLFLVSRAVCVFQVDPLLRADNAYGLWD